MLRTFLHAILQNISQEHKHDKDHSKTQTKHL